MSRVTLTTVSPGEATTITGPNQFQDDLEAALSSVNEQNIRTEGIDRRNIDFPICIESGFMNVNSRTAVTTTSNTWVPYPNTFQVSISMTDCFAAIIRFSGEVRLDGVVATVAEESPQFLGVRMSQTKDGVVGALAHTERYFQIGRHPDASASAQKFPGTFEFQMTHLVENQSLTDTSNRTFTLEYNLKNPASGSTGTASIGFLNAHIQKYKG
mgnify:CR=1 FL=1